MMEKTSNHVFGSALIKATACAFLSMGCLPVWAETGSMGTDAVEVVQQTVNLRGTVKDANGEPIIGANVMEKGTTNGTITDFDGNFTLSVSRKSSLIISYIGYKTIEVPAAQAKSGKLDVTLQEDSEALEEVVVIGYGTQKKADVTSAVASVKSEGFNKGAILDAGQLVQGKVAGLQISLPSGDPTASTSVMLRGNSTLMGTSQPLILVDGVPGSFSTVAPEEIESIDVLKDGSATAIYGTRGTNGVIIITTKNANREMPATIEYNG
ncbi:MAG: carboxypeptidase-like regulatory domain-containing protein, partial [Bacteroidaceae bacterium]|nr:carboxypeptidase-like regulatory domain-containing protein [Bacteroidaceae bacterium]